MGFRINTDVYAYTEKDVCMLNCQMERGWGQFNCSNDVIRIGRILFGTSETKGETVTSFLRCALKTEAKFTASLDPLVISQFSGKWFPT